MLKQILSYFAQFLIGLTLLIMTGCTPASKGLFIDPYYPPSETEDALVDNNEGRDDVVDSSSNDKDD